jgi:hypothetical protein
MIARSLFALIGLAALLGMAWLVRFAEPYFLWHRLPFGEVWAWVNIPAIFAGIIVSNNAHQPDTTAVYVVFVVQWFAGFFGLSFPVFALWKSLRRKWPGWVRMAPLVGVGVLLTGLVIVVVTHEMVLSSDRLQWLRLPALLVSRPPDIVVLLNEVIDISQAGASKQMTFSNRYSGYHAVCLIPAAPRGNPTIYWRQASITVDISMEGGSKTRKISIRSEDLGCTEYLAPEDLPVGSPVLVTATVTETVAIVTEEYAPVRLRVVEEPWR